MTQARRGLPRYIRRRATTSALYLFLFLVFLLIAVGVYKGGIQVVELQAGRITIGELPFALTLSFLRMLSSFLASLVFSFIVGLLAARTKWGERIIIPVLDILQSVPIVGFFPAAITFFISVTNGHRMGIELAACFLIFTSMTWNLAFAIYESVKSLPSDYRDAASSFGVKGSQRFWKLYYPTCVPRLVYNSMLSWSNGWFFLVACEIIAVGPVRYNLPGIGSFLSRAAEQNEISLIGWGLAALTLLILFLDYTVWRPTSVWAQRFKQDSTSPTEGEPVSYPSLPQNIITRLKFLRRPARQLAGALTYPFVWSLREVFLPLFWDLPVGLFKWFMSEQRERLERLKSSRTYRILVILLKGLGFTLLTLAIALLAYQLYLWLKPPWPAIASKIPLAVLASTGRLIVTLLIALAWVLPVVILVWNKPRTRQFLTTISQIGAGIPAIALFPLFILIVVSRLGGGMELASILLLLTGMQWYLLFNCLGGSAAIPNELSDATRSLGLSRTQIWKKLVLPGIRPAMITGAITAWGGGWNALVVAEYVVHKDEILAVNGIGALLNQAVYELGDGRAISLCIAAMVAWILFLNVVFWRPVYQYAIERFKFET